MCFSMAWLQQVLILIVVILATFALLKLLLSYIVPGLQFWPVAVWPPHAGVPPGAGGLVGFIITALYIVFWAFVAIAMIIFVFMLIGCLWSFTGGFSSLLPHR